MPSSVNPQHTPRPPRLEAPVVVLMHHPYGQVRQRTQFIFAGLDGSVVLTRHIEVQPGEANVRRVTLPPLRAIAFGRPYRTLAKLFARRLERQTPTDALFVLTHEAQIPLIPTYRRFIFDFHDDNAAFFSGRTAKAFVHARREAIARADRVVVSSADLARTVERLGPKATPHLIENGFEPSFIQPFERPDTRVAVYFGSIEHWFDFEAVLRLANSGYRIRLIGRIGNGIIIPAHPLFEVLGPRDHADLPGLCRDAALLLLPFKRSELIDAVNPVKLYEYIALGRPVVSSYWPELDRFSSFVNFYSPASGITLAAEAAQAQQPSELARSDFLASNSWQSRRESYVNLVNELVAGTSC